MSYAGTAAILLGFGVLLLAICLIGAAARRHSGQVPAHFLCGCALAVGLLAATFAVVAWL